MMLEQEIEKKLQRLQGKVPTIIIKELQDKLVSKMDILTPEQVDLIIDKVLENYSSQVERLTKLDRRVEEIGKYLKEVREHLVGASSVNTASTAIPGYSDNEITNQEYVEPSTLEKEVEFKEEEKEMGEEFKIPQDIREVLTVQQVGKARLERLPDDMVSTMIALKWLGFLIDKAGIQNLENVLEFYYRIGWISENVLNTLLTYANGTKPHYREPNWRPEDKLTIQDHLISLLFIERLRGGRVTREVLDSIEREIKMMNRVLEQVYGV
ncbi:FlaD/FlaE family flagellar protein [Palaeococcus sp. (in: euryarchaeotes)]|nr:MAG: flagellar protein [Thermococci archaeon]